MRFIEGEIITAEEALNRVGLGDLATDYEKRTKIEWTGYPKPFSCGHTAEYGYGPDDDKPVEPKDMHRRYKQLHRVSQATAGGPILFSWPTIGDSNGSPFYLAGGFAIVVVEASKSPALRVAHLA